MGCYRSAAIILHVQSAIGKDGWLHTDTHQQVTNAEM